MSRRKLKAYLEELSKQELESQILELHDRLKEVKDFYKFVFNPQEDLMIEDAKLRISKEYFPVGKRKRPKKRRSVAQNKIKEFLKLGVDPQLILDVMLFNIEIALTYNEEYPIKQEAFYKSMLKSYREAFFYAKKNGLLKAHLIRFEKIIDAVYEQNWFNKSAFEAIME